MKKFFRNLFSGYFIILLLLLIELGAFVFVQFFLDDVIAEYALSERTPEQIRLIVTLVYLFLRVVIFIVGVIIFFKIIAKQEDPEFKIPWIVGMLLMPFFVSMLFIIFGNHGLRPKEKKILKANIAAYEKNYKVTEEKKQVYFDVLGPAAGAFKYIANTTGMDMHAHNHVTYYKNGETFFPALLEGLKQAKEFIFIEFFIISDGQEWTDVLEILKQKAQEGVEVRIIYDDMGCSGTISSRTPKLLKKYGINCVKFHPFRPILSGVYNNRDHRKIVVIDHQMAFTGGINLADEYANLITRFGYWKDTMVKIEGSAINNLIAIFLQNYSLATYEIGDYDKYLKHDYPRIEEYGFILPFGDGPGDIDEALVGEQTYINILNYAQHEVFISTPYLVPTYELLDALRNAALRGVKVHLILPGIPDKKLVYTMAQSNFRFLLDAGVNIYTYTPGFNHMKTILADDNMALVGTINYDFRSLVHHFECAVLMYNCACAKDIKEDFLEMISASNKVPSYFKQKKKTRLFCALIKLISPLL